MTSPSAPKLTLPVGSRDHIQGPIAASITLVEYGDYECPYCGEAYVVIKAVQEQLNESLRFVFRNFPLVNSHPHAQHAAEAAEAAAGHGRFWQMHGMLYENQEALGDDNLAEYAVALGLNGRQLVADVLAGAQTARVREDFLSGVQAGVNGTPSFFINGVRYDGEHDFDAML